MLHKPHSFATPAADCLDQNRKLGGGRIFIPGRNNGNPGLLHHAFGFKLVTHRPNRFRTWPYKSEAVRFAGGRKMGILRKEAIPGMYCVGGAFLRSADDLLYVEITSYGISLTDREGVQCAFIGFGENGGSYNTHLAQCARDTHGNFAAICDENLTDHFPSLRSTGSAVS